MTLLLDLVAQDLDRSADRYAERVLERVTADLPPIVADVELQRLARIGTAALLHEFGEGLRVGLSADYHAPPATTAYAIRLAAAGVPLADVLRSYRLGQETVIELATRLTADADDRDPQAALAELIGRSFRFVDGVLSDIARTYQRERDRIVRRDVAHGAAIAGRLLAGEEIDRETAERALAYRLDGPHVAIVCWTAGDARDRPVAVDRLAEAVRPLSGARPLTIADGATGAAAWVTRPRGLDDHELEQLAAALAPAGLRAATGDALSGSDGFVRSRRQAERAAAGARALPGPVAVRYRDVALLTLLLADAPAAREFARDELGPLAAADPVAERLRTAVATLYATGHDRSRAAQALGVHRNTVTRRLQRAEELLGHRLDQRAREVEAALAIVAALGPS